MRNRILLILLGASMFILACDGKFMLIDCPDCTVDEPTDAVIEVKLEEESRFTTIVRVYEGTIDDNILLSTHHPLGSTLEVIVSVNKIYTFAAEYSDGTGRIYIAIDSAYPRVKLEKQQCEAWCYYVYDRKVNLALKYEK